MSDFPTMLVRFGGEPAHHKTENGEVITVSAAISGASAAAKGSETLWITLFLNEEQEKLVRKGTQALVSGFIRASHAKFTRRNGDEGEGVNFTMNVNELRPARVKREIEFLDVEPEVNTLASVGEGGF